MGTGSRKPDEGVPRHRASQEMTEVGDDVRRLWEEHAYRYLAGAAVLLLAVGTVTYRLVEGWTWVDAFYFSAIAVTTVGFGDLAPTSDGAKLFTVIYVFSGIGVITTFLNVRLRRHARRLAKSATATGADPSNGDPNPTEHRP